MAACGVGTSLSLTVEHEENSSILEREGVKGGSRGGSNDNLGGERKGSLLLYIVIHASASHAGYSSAQQNQRLRSGGNADATFKAVSASTIMRRNKMGSSVPFLFLPLPFRCDKYITPFRGEPADTGKG